MSDEIKLELPYVYVRKYVETLGDAAPQEFKDVVSTVQGLMKLHDEYGASKDLRESMYRVTVPMGMFK